MTALKPDAPRSVADISAGVILARIDVPSGPARTFRALTDAQEIDEWWGDDDFQATLWTSDARVGGSWGVEGRRADGRTFSVYGKYLEVDAPHKVVRTWNQQAHDEPTRLTYRLEATDVGTRVTVRHEGFVDVRWCRIHGDGWEDVLEWLAQYLKQDADALS